MSIPYRILLISLTLILPAGTACAESRLKLSSDEFWYCPTDRGSFLVLQVARDESSLTRIGYREKDKKNFSWQEVIGQAISAVSMDENLYVVFRDGMIFRFGAADLQLPGIPKVKAKRLFTDKTNKSIFLLATTEEKTPIWKIFNFRGGKWEKIAELPDELNQIRRPKIIANNGRIRIFLRPKDEQLKILVLKNGKWEKEQNITINPEVEKCWPVALPQTQAVVCKTSKGIYTYTPSQSKPLTLDGSAFLPAGPITVATVADRIAIGFFDEKNKEINLSYWTSAGKYVKSDNPVKPFVTTKAPQEPSMLFTILMVVTVILAVFSRGTAAQSTQELPEGFAPADYWRRTAAFMLDFFPISFMGSLIGYNYIEHIPVDGELLEYIQALQNDTNMYYLAMIVTLVYITYCAIMEMKFGWTIGKRVLGLEVRQGRNPEKRINWIQAVLRNLVKILELNFPPLIFVMMINRRRQRLGDMIAGTVVLQKKKTPGGIDEHA